MRSDKSFKDFLFSEGKYKRLLPLVILGVILILLSSFVQEKEAAEPTLEEELVSVCSSLEGVGECRVMISYSENGETVEAVAVICEGADSAAVRARIISLIESLFGIRSGRISVLKIES